MTATRRLAAILAVDVVGYSRAHGRGRGGDGEGASDITFNAHLKFAVKCPRFLKSGVNHLADKFPFDLCPGGLTVTT